MPLRVLIAVLVILLVCLLAAAAAQAEARDRQRKATEQASGALTSVMPTIHDIDTRHVDEPGGTTPT